MREPPPTSVVVFAALGPNPAPLTELIWGLAREEGVQRFEVHVVVERRARLYLDRELLAPGAALHQLRECLGDTAIGPVTIHEAKDADGALIEDDVEPESREAYTEAVWTGARQAVEAAGARPVVFGLLAGRRRTMTALETAVFQLLARASDRLLDVRVSDPRVEGGTGFFFPEQPELQVCAKRSKDLIEARSVQVILVELELPRLRPLVPPAALSSLRAARQAADRVILDVAPVELQVDLQAGVARANGEKIPLPPSQLVWFAYLCVRMKQGAIWVAPHDFDSLRAFLATLSELAWWQEKIPPGSIFKQVAGGDVTDPDDNREVDVWRSKTMRTLRKFASARGRGRRALVPEGKKKKVEGGKARNHHRLPLNPAFIEILGLQR